MWPTGYPRAACIPDIRTALKAKDEDYVKLLKRQAADVDALLSAMGRQLSEMTAAYREELEAVEGVLMQVGAAGTAAAALQHACAALTPDTARSAQHPSTPFTWLAAG